MLMVELQLGPTSWYPRHPRMCRSFYQWVPEGCVWTFGLYWGHSVSEDLVRWEHLPPALVPTPGSLDQDGCFRWLL
jgi:hypothetical protein